MTMHIYIAPWQPATKFIDANGPGEPVTVRWPQNMLVRCDKCNKLRRAKNCEVQVLYDCMNTRCKKGAGCRK